MASAALVIALATHAPGFLAPAPSHARLRVPAPVRAPCRLGPRGAQRMRALPSDVKGLLEELRVATQAALSSRLSRIDVELPLGMSLLSSDGGASQDVAASSRDLARIFCEMFSELEATSVVAFPAKKLATAAQKAWGSEVKVRCVSLVAPSKKAASAKPVGGFGGASKVPKGKTEASGVGVPGGTEIVFCVGPFDGPALAAVEALSRRFDQSVLIVMLNAHLDDGAAYASDAQREYFADTFERVFCFRPVRTAGGGPESSEVGQELLVYRAFPAEWTLARMRKMGKPQELARQEEFFAREDIEEALERAGPPEAGALEAISSFFKLGK